MKLPQIPVILGPTASGKTSVGIQLAKFLNGEIISVDSRKVYKGIPIGTATPKGRWVDGAYYVQGIAHHLMAYLPPDEFYTAGDFAKEAEELMIEILLRKKTPILVGGTGFYFKALQKGLPELPNRDEKIREHLSKRIEKEGLDSLHSELKSIDPQAAENIATNDPHKIIRALEVFTITGQPFSKWKESPKKPSKFSFTVMGTDFSKEELEERIKIRSKRMFDRGMIKEAEKLMIKGYPKTCPALSSFGYKEAVQVIEGTLPMEEFLPSLIKGTISYAKRQRTWFRTQAKPSWFMCDKTSKKEDIALKMRDFLKSQ